MDIAVSNNMPVTTAEKAGGHFIAKIDHERLVSKEPFDNNHSRIQQTQELYTRNSERGSTMVEYALLVALMAIGSIGAISSVREEVGYIFEDTGEKLAQASWED